MTTPTDAMATIKDLFAKYGITSSDGAHEDIRQRFSQDDLDVYYDAKALLMQSGALG